MKRLTAVLSGVFLTSAVGLLAVAGWLLVTDGDEGPARAVEVPVRTAPPEQSLAGDPVAAVPPDVQVAEPVAVRVASVGIDAETVPLDLDGEGALTPPPYGLAGWWTDGPEPGEVGASVIAGHVDSRRGPDVFLRLREVREGDRIEVERADGTTTVFVVTGREQAPKDAFPTDAVYTPTPTPTLRLITCGGEIDPESGRYIDNVIVYADVHAGDVGSGAG